MSFALTPAQVGLPPKFQQWRPNQGEGLDVALADLEQYRFLPVNMPVGTGKSPWYIALALLMDWRTLILTASKTLQDQLLRDFSSIGLVDIRGRANYPCKMAATFTCEDGAHAKCLYTQGNSGCEYKAAYNRAIQSHLVVTNYKYWPLVCRYGEGLGRFDCIVLDEAHDAPDQICSLMQVTLTSRDVFQMLNRRWPDNADDCGIETWRDWSRIMLPLALHEQQIVKDQITDAGYAPEVLVREAARWSSLVHKLTSISTAQGPWASEPTKVRENTGYVLEPLWADEYAEDTIFQGIPHVILISATVRPKTLDLLGIQPGEYAFREYPYIFPVNRAPIYYIPTAYCGQSMTDEEQQAIIDMINRIVGRRLDRKGLIQTPSYKLAEQIMRGSRYPHWMITHERNSVATENAVMRLKSCAPPAVLVSPSISTGLDFAYGEAEYQVIPKLPFPVVKGSRIMEARCNKKQGGDPEYADYLMVQHLVQSCGRIMRAPDDRGETFILDMNLNWVRTRCKRQFPAWFNSLFRRRVSPPDDPPPPLYAAGANRSHPPDNGQDQPF